MRVLQLTTDLRFGGAERVVLNLARGLRRRGVECAVAGLTAGGEARGALQERLKEEGFPVYSARLSVPGRLRRAAGLRRFALEWRPDLLHCHLFHAHAAGVALRRLGLRCPMVWTHHRVNPRPDPCRPLFYRLASSAAAHVYASQAVRDFQRRRAGPAPRGRVIHNGIELAPFLAVRPRPGGVYGAMGRMVPLHKGFDVLIRAFARLCREDDGAALRIAGDGPERAALEELARREGVAERVEFAGFVTDVPAFLDRVNVFVNPSRWEAFGFTLLEAIAAGLPCIASRVGGLVEVGGDVVRWVEPEDVEGLAVAMAETGPGACAPAQVASRRRRAHRFTAEVMTDAYLALFREVLTR
jgi:glycosyltransferase involved in cell wall biosynthesis